MSEFKSQPGISRIIWRILVVFALVCYALIAFDFFTHLFAAGTNATVGTPYLFRWLSFVAGTFTVIVALFIIARVRENIVGPLLLIYGVGAVGWSGRLEWESVTQLAWFTTVFSFYFNALALPALIGMFFYFPTGHAHPPRMKRWVPVLCLSLSILGMLTTFGTSPAQQSGVPNPIYNPLFEPVVNLSGMISTFALLAALVTVFLRYWHGGTRERLQLKWVLWSGGMLIAITLMVGFTPTATVGDLMFAKMAAILRVIVFILWQSFAAVAFGIAMLRYRLWDIDVIIRRTLVYSILTGLLALIYFGGVVLLQQLTRSISASSDLAIAVSTLVIAALFFPLRRRVQATIDRRFYRRKYDAAKTLAAFGVTVRDEVELDKLTNELLNVVSETMEPASVSLWLRKQ